MLVGIRGCKTIGENRSSVNLATKLAELSARERLQSNALLLVYEGHGVRSACDRRVSVLKTTHGLAMSDKKEPAGETRST
jgi:hypothetical protein